MTLNDHLIATGQTNREFGRLIGVSEMTVSRWRNFRHRPGIDWCVRVAHATDGKVMPNDFLTPVERAAVEPGIAA